MLNSILDDMGSPDWKERLDVLARSVAGPGAEGRRLVSRTEAVVEAGPSSAFQLDADGMAWLVTEVGSWHAGRFQIPSLGELRRRDADPTRTGPGPIRRGRLIAIHGDSPLTDIGALQAHDDGHTTFQVASQFNCLEAPGPHLVPVRGYFGDPTQGPRASISAFPGTLLRHYRAPDGEGGSFVQSNPGPQINLLRDVVPPGVARVRQGYLRAGDVLSPDHLLASLESAGEQVRVGVQEKTEVVLGYAWTGPVIAPPPRVNQVFTSTLAAGMYSPGLDLETEGVWRSIAGHLLGAAYEGTLRATRQRGSRRVLLTLIGGGVFANPHDLISRAIDQALARTRVLDAGLDVVLNLHRNNPAPFESLLGGLSGIRVDLGARVVHFAGG